MRQPCLLLCLLSAGLLLMAGQAAGAPRVTAQTQLSAQPAALSLGQAGPFNRIAFFVERFGPPDASSSVTCFYPAAPFFPAALHYRCDVDMGESEIQGAIRRVTVTIPDLGRGKQVIVRFSTKAGHLDVPIELANSPQVVHEIESLPLSGGGAIAVGPNGQPTPMLNVISTRATTMPAMAASSMGTTANACDQIRAEWVNASATDPVFQSQFGPLNGSVVLSKPVMPGSRVYPANLPEWLVSYPLSAIRVQFIAHYEVIYRVGSCPHRVISDPGT